MKLVLNGLKFPFGEPLLRTKRQRRAFHDGHVVRLRPRDRERIMPSAPRIIVKDSHPLILEKAKVPPQGRSYCTEHSQQPSGIRIDEITLAAKLSFVSITDDKPNTLKKVGRANPWQIDVMKHMLGSEEEADKPLTEILDKHFGLHLDHHINISGFSKAGHVIDTQGYVAHNDEMIVVAYRCTTSGLDWLTNMTTTSSAWEREDIDQGHSGYISSIDSACCVSGEDYKPRVHTGFYNNFLASAPALRTHVDPLLSPDQPPRKLYIVGHSLGAGIATMATVYYLLEHDWETLPHKLISVTLGGPRACCQSMQETIDAKVAALRPLDKAVLVRLVRDKDVVPTVPPTYLGFRHLDKLVFVTKDGAILINPNLSSPHILSKKEMRQLREAHPTVLPTADTGDEDSEGETVETDFEKSIQAIPRAIRDHMPGFYLHPLEAALEKETNPSPIIVVQDGVVADDKCDSVVAMPAKSRPRFLRMFGRGRRTPKGKVMAVSQ
jgi:Lipase (class 3)